MGSGRVTATKCRRPKAAGIPARQLMFVARVLPACLVSAAPSQRHDLSYLTSLTAQYIAVLAVGCSCNSRTALHNTGHFV